MGKANSWLTASLLLWAPLLAGEEAGAAGAPPCHSLEEAGVSYAVCEFDVRNASPRLFLRDEKGALYGDFSRLASDVEAKGETLVFAMNAGMYDADFSPVGLYVEAGVEAHAANTAAGQGNFHMKPNGVFWVTGARAGVTETGRFVRSHMHPAYATQSGPMLLVGGRVNPHIHETGTSEKFRNGVGVADGGIIRFAISNQPVTFHRFARLFRDRLKCADALFLDGGSASALYAPSLSRRDMFHPIGPIIGVVEKR